MRTCKLHAYQLPVNFCRPRLWATVNAIPAHTEQVYAHSVLPANFCRRSGKSRSASALATSGRDQQNVVAERHTILCATAFGLLLCDSRASTPVCWAGLACLLDCWTRLAAAQENNTHSCAGNHPARLQECRPLWCHAFDSCTQDPSTDV